MTQFAFGVGGGGCDRHTNTGSLHKYWEAYINMQEVKSSTSTHCEARTGAHALLIHERLALIHQHAENDQQV